MSTTAHPSARGPGAARQPVRSVAALTVAVSLAGCTGIVTEPVNANGPPAALVRPSCDGVSTAIAVPARRLTAPEYRASLVAMFGPTVDELPVADDYPGGSVTAYPYSTFAEGHLVDEEAVRRLLTTAEELAEHLLPTLTMCDSGDFDACAHARFGEWGSIAFRRPATSEEIDELAGEAVSALADGFARNEALAVGIVRLLQDPRFLYVVESTPGDAWSISPAQRAQRVSLTLGLNVPDDLDPDAVAALATPEGLSAEVDRWIEGDARLAFRQFVMEWLGIRELPTTHSEEVRTSLREELYRLIDDVYDADEGFEVALRSDHAYVDSVLEEFYGLLSQSSGPGDFRQVSLEGRIGLLTHPLVMAHGAHGEDTSPVLRGRLIQLNLLCGHLDPPPAAAMGQEPMLPDNATPRDRYFARSQNSTCQGCHLMLDPLGFAFEGYDALGRYRTEAYGAPVDATGAVNNSFIPGLDGQFDGIDELSQRFLDNEEIAFCFARQWTRYAYGVNDEDRESMPLRCSADRVGERFVASNGNVREMLRAYAEDPSFVERQPETME